jgi:pimeloyl-ACP methyl ester carboxylesterase
MASATAIPSRRTRDAAGVAEVYIGGAADAQSRIVTSYVAARQGALSREGGHRSAAWFSYSNFRGVMAHCVDAAARGDALVLVGHSWGSDTALKVAHRMPCPVALLAGIDPVARNGRVLTRVSRRPQSAKTVVHVDARPRRLDRSDVVKAMGVVMGLGLAPAFRRADLKIVTPFNHWAFADMMAAQDATGRSVARMIDDLRTPANRVG